MDLGKISYRIALDNKAYLAQLKQSEQASDHSNSRMAATFGRLAASIGLVSAAWRGWKEARSFSSELANIKSIAGEFDLSKLRREIIGLSSVLGTSAELANAVYFAYSAGVRGSESDLVRFTGRIAELAKTIGGGVTPVMDAATTLMNAYGKSVQDTGAVCDWFFQVVKSGKTTGGELAQSLGQIAATAAASGVSLDDLGAALATLTTTMPTNIAVTSLAAALRTLMNPTEETATMARQLGIDMSMAAIKVKGLGGVMTEIAAATGGRGDLIGKLFPAESSRAVIALAGGQLSTLQQNIVDFSTNAGAAASAFTARVDNLDDAVKGVYTTLIKIAAAFGQTAYDVATLGGALKPVIGWFAGLKSESIALAARLLTIVTVALGIRKAFSMIRPIALNLAVKGGMTAANTAATAADTAATAANTAAKNANTVAGSQNAVAATSGAVAKTADAAAATTGAAAHGVLSVAMHACKGAAISLWAVLIANPVTTVLVLISSLIAMIVYLISRAKAARKENAINAATEDITKAEKERSETKKSYERALQAAEDADKSKMRLKRLMNKTLSQDEFSDAKTIIAALKIEYGEFGMAVDKQTSRIISEADAWERLNKAKLKNLGETAKRDYNSTIKEEAAQKKLFMAENNRLSDAELNALQETGKLTGCRDILKASRARQDYKKEIAERKKLDQEWGKTDDGKKFALKKLNLEKQMESYSSGKLPNDNNSKKDNVAQEKERLEVMRQQNILLAKAEAMKDGFLSRQEKINSTEMEYKNQLSRIAELELDLKDTERNFSDNPLKIAEAEKELAAAKVTAGELHVAKMAEELNMRRDIAEQKRESALSETKSQAIKSGESSQSYNLTIAKAEMERQKAREAKSLAERDRIGSLQKGSESVEYVTADAEYKREQARTLQMGREYAEKHAAYARDMQNTRLQLEYQKKYNSLAKDGVITAKDNLVLAKLEADQLAKKIKAAAGYAAAMKNMYGVNSDEYRKAVTAQEKMQADLYESDRRRKMLASEIADKERSHAANAMLAKAWADGQLTVTEKRAIAERGIADQAQRVKEAEEAVRAARYSDARREAENALNLARIELGKQKAAAQQNAEKSNSFVTFDTSILSMVTGSTSEAKRTAKAAEESLSYQKKIEKNTQRRGITAE